MTTTELEARLNAAASVAAPPRSIADEVMRQLGLVGYHAAPSQWRRPLIAAVLGDAVSPRSWRSSFFSSGSADFTMADVQRAVEQQH